MRKKVKRGMSPVVRTSMTCSLKENGREFVLVVPCRRKPDTIHIDDKPYTELLKSRCDYAIEVFHDEPKRAFFFVELKGEAFSAMRNVCSRRPSTASSTTLARAAP